MNGPPLGAYEIIYGKYDVKKMRVGLREQVGDDWKAINYISLPSRRLLLDYRYLL